MRTKSKRSEEATLGTTNARLQPTSEAQSKGLPSEEESVPLPFERLSNENKICVLLYTIIIASFV